MDLKKNVFLYITGGILAWYLFIRKPDMGGQIEYLIGWAQDTSPASEVIAFTDKLHKMNEAEIETVYDYIHDYVTKNRDLTEGSDLFNKIMAISNKYQIFT